MHAFLKALMADESGQDLAEYGLLLAFISASVIGILALFGEPIRELFQSSRAGVEQAAEAL